MTTNRATGQSIAEVVSISEMEGGSSKFLTVPEGFVGIAYCPNGPVETYQPGRHQVKKFSQRLFNQGGTTLYGLIPQGEIPLLIHAPYLSSRDGVLLDLRLFCRAKVIDPGLFFETEVLPMGEITPPVLEMDTEAASAIFSTLAAQYHWKELVEIFDLEKLRDLMFPELPHLLESHGLSLLSADQVVFYRSEEREEAERKVSEIEKEAGKLGIALPDDIHIQDEKTGSWLGRFSFAGAGKVGEQDLIKEIRMLFPDDSQKKRKRRRGMLERLLQNRKHAGQESHVRLPRFWWLGRSSLILFLVSSGSVITAVVLKLGENVEGFDPWSFILVGVWGVILPLVFNSAYKMVEKREKLAEKHWAAPGSFYLDDLVKDNRQEADRVMRQHCAGELRQVVDVLHDIRKRVFTDGEMDKALKLRTLERKISDAADQVMSAQFAPAPYRQDVRLPERAWVKMLNYDEALMRFANGLSDAASKAQQFYVDIQIGERTLLELERYVDLFMTKFAARSRLLKS